VCCTHPQLDLIHLPSPLLVQQSVFDNRDLAREGERDGWGRERKRGRSRVREGEREANKGEGEPHIEVGQGLLRSS
jgi:hypothetical protein